MTVKCVQQRQYSGQGFLLFTSCRSNILHGRSCVTETQFQMFEDVLGWKGWWNRWIQWIFGYWEHEENTGLGEVSVHCVGDIFVYLLLKMQSALSCWHAVFPGRVVAMNTDTGYRRYWNLSSTELRWLCILSIPGVAVHPVLNAWVGNFIWGLNYPKYWKATVLSSCAYMVPKKWPSILGRFLASAVSVAVLSVAVRGQHVAVVGWSVRFSERMETEIYRVPL